MFFWWFFKGRWTQLTQCSCIVLTNSRFFTATSFLGLFWVFRMISVPLHCIYLFGVMKYTLKSFAELTFIQGFSWFCMGLWG